MKHPDAHHVAQCLAGTFSSNVGIRVEDVVTVNDKQDEDSPAEHRIDTDITIDGHVYNVSLTVTSMGPK